jgi:hypothetical protein
LTYRYHDVWCNPVAVYHQATLVALAAIVACQKGSTSPKQRAQAFVEQATRAISASALNRNLEWVNLAFLANNGGKNRRFDAHESSAPLDNHSKGKFP